MEFLADSNNLKIAITICVIIYIILTLALFFVLHKKGVNVYSLKNSVKIVVAFAPIITVPIWLLPKGSLLAKAIGSIVVVAVGIVCNYSLHYYGRIMRKMRGIETEEDRRETEEKEKKRKEKEAKRKSE